MSQTPHSSFGTLVRFFGSALIASLVVVAGAAFAIHYFENPPRAENVQGVAEVLRGVHLISLANHPEIERLLRAQRDREHHRLPDNPPPPPPLAPREVSGFVQVAFTVLPDGSVTDVHVIGAAPSGYYEDQAKAIISARHFAPKLINGQPVAHRMDQIVTFTVPEKPGVDTATTLSPGLERHH